MFARSAYWWTSSVPWGLIARRRPFRATLPIWGCASFPRVSELVTGVLRTDNLVMIKAQPGTASGIAAAVDAAELPDVLGSLAGNDTILVIAQTAEDGERLEALINKLSNSRK